MEHRVRHRLSTKGFVLWTGEPALRPLWDSRVLLYVCLPVGMKCFC